MAIVDLDRQEEAIPLCEYVRPKRGGRNARMISSAIPATADGFRVSRCSPGMTGRVVFVIPAKAGIQGMKHRAGVLFLSSEAISARG